MKVANIKTDLRKFFHYWIKVSQPLHHLTKREGEVLSELLYHRFFIVKEVKRNNTVINQLLFHYSIRKKIEKTLGLKYNSLNNILNRLRRKKIIQNGGINKAYIPEIKEGDNQFIFAYKFILEGNERTNKKEIIKENAKNIK